MRVTTGWIALALVGLAAASCTPAVMRKFDAEHNDYHDRHLGLSRNDYRNIDKPDAPEGEMPPGNASLRQNLRKGQGGAAGPDGMLGTGEQAKDITTKIETKAPPIPTLAQILATPQPPKIGETQLVSIAVTDDVPLKDVLIELGRLANVDIELDAGIAGGISFTANDRPFNEVIGRIADLAGLRYTMKNGVLRIERDTPYIRNYSLDFLNLVRNSQSSVNISTNVLSGGGAGGGGSGGGGGSSGGGGGGSSSGGGGGGINTGSTSAINSTSDSDLWSSLQNGIKEILAYAPSKRVSPLASTVPEVEQARADEAAVAAAAQQAAASNGANPAAVPAPVGVAGGAAGGNGLGSGQGKGLADTFFILNRQAGMLTISANDKQHQLIETFLNKMRANSSAQVLIEAKIVEITLAERYQSGIQWSVLGSKYGLDLAAASVPAAAGGATSTIRLGDGTDLDNLINLIEEFGTTRTLSSPRLSAINNQQAVLTFARNQVYFHLTIEQSTTTSVGNLTSQLPPTVTSEVKTVPIGLILTLQPSINLDTNEITLNVRPTLSRLAGTVPDPAAAFLAATATGGSATTLARLQNNVPIVEVRELDSILKVKSGEVMVIGGLMEQGGTDQDAGVPFASEVPWFGNLFKNTAKTNTSTELVIFIRATVVDSNGNTHKSDEQMYNKFTRDPRPLDF